MTRGEQAADVHSRVIHWTTLSGVPTTGMKWIMQRQWPPLQQRYLLHEQASKQQEVKCLGS